MLGKQVMCENGFLFDDFFVFLFVFLIRLYDDFGSQKASLNLTLLDRGC
jgi:hypothetical protein